MLEVLKAIRSIVSKLYTSGDADSVIGDCQTIFQLGIVEGKAQAALVPKVVPNVPTIGQGTLESVIGKVVQRRKIEAIKELRAATGWGLKDSKEFCDILQNFVS